MEQTEEQNKSRYITKIVHEICAEQNVSCESFSGDWIFRLCHQNRIAFICGYHFDVNNSASAKICDDKCATASILSHAGIPVVAHYYYMPPSNMHYIGESGNWSQLTAFLNKHKKIVCKTNQGTGGNSVYLIENQSQLEKATQDIFNLERDLAASAYYDIIKEYRVVIFDGEVELVYAKNTPFVIGDGQSTIHSLLLRYMEKHKCLIDPSNIESKALFSVLPEGTQYRIGWKSNLGKGAIPQIVLDGEQKTKLMQLAKITVNALAIRFASVDIIKTEQELRVLEVNSGIMMENFVRADKANHYPIAKQIYQKAIAHMLSIV